MFRRPRVDPDRIRTVNPAACVFCIALLATGSALAQAVRPAADYPARVVRWVVPFTPGASNDVIALAQGGQGGQRAHRMTFSCSR